MHKEGVGLLKKCKACGAYTFREACPACGGETSSPKPPKFSPNDKYWKQRLIAKGAVE